MQLIVEDLQPTIAVGILFYGIAPKHNFKISYLSWLKKIIYVIILLGIAFQPAKWNYSTSPTFEFEGFLNSYLENKANGQLVVDGVLNVPVFAQFLSRNTLELKAFVDLMDNGHGNIQPILPNEFERFKQIHYEFKMTRRYLISK